MATALRQFSTQTWTADISTWTTEFDSAPLAGSLMVAVFGFTGDPGQTIAANNSYTKVQSEVERTQDVAGFAKLAGSSESSSVTFTMTGGTSASSAAVMMEFTGDFDAASVSSALVAESEYDSNPQTTKQCPPLNISGEYLVVPTLGLGGEGSLPEINLSHSFVAHARPGTQHWQRSAAAAWRDVTNDASHAPTWTWTSTTVKVVSQMAFPLDVSPSTFALSGSESTSVSLSWDDNLGGPFKVLRDTVEIASGVSGTSYVDTSVVTGTQYVYEIEDSSATKTNPLTLKIAGSGGVFYLRRDGSGWSSVPA